MDPWLIIGSLAWRALLASFSASFRVLQSGEKMVESSDPNY